MCCFRLAICVSGLPVKKWRQSNHRDQLTPPPHWCSLQWSRTAKRNSNFLVTRCGTKATRSNMTNEKLHADIMADTFSYYGMVHYNVQTNCLVSHGTQVFLFLKLYGICHLAISTSSLNKRTSGATGDYKLWCAASVKLYFRRTDRRSRWYCIPEDKERKKARARKGTRNNNRMSARADWFVP